MLRLSRKIGEKIIIGECVEVQLVSIDSRGQVTLGISAPPDVPIHREEIQRKIYKEMLKHSTFDRDLLERKMKIIDIMNTIPTGEWIDNGEEGVNGNV